MLFDMRRMEKKGCRTWRAAPFLCKNNCQMSKEPDSLCITNV